MRTLLKRLAALESMAGPGENGWVVAFMVDGASDDDVTSARNMYGDQVDREPGEALASMVGRLKARQPHALGHLLSFEYADGLKERLGLDYLPETLPNSWPIPSDAGHACHVAHRP